MIEYFVKKRKITLLFFAIATLVGFISFASLPKQEMPDVTVQQALVTTIYPGASPQKVEQSVTKVLEKKIKEVADVKTIRSTSGNGYSSIIVESQKDAVPAAVWDEMRKKVQDASADLPSDAEVPEIDDQLTQAFIGSYALTSDSREALLTMKDTMLIWEDQLRTVEGVSKVTISGIPDQEVRIEIDTQKLAQYQLSWAQVMQAIQGHMDRVPTGNLDYDQRNYQVVIRDTTDPERLNAVQIARSESGSPVYLRDIGNSTLSFDKDEQLSYVDGKPAITVQIHAKNGTDIPSMNERVEHKLNELTSSLPENITFETVFAQRDKVADIFAGLTKETIIAIAAVVLICTMGLHLLTSSFVAMAIPISIAIAMIFVPMLGVTLNQISVVGLIIVLGILVDDAVVVNDNIERRLTELGESPKEAALNGTKEVSISILTATLATISAFAPLLFLKGDVGAFIKPIPIVISLAMLASMLMSFTIIPIFREWYEKRRKRVELNGKPKPAGLLGRQIQALNQLYSGKLMPKVVKRPLLTGLAGLLVGTAAYGLVLFTPIELFPESEDPHMAINLTMPVGTSLSETHRIVKEAAEWVQEQPEASRVTFTAGGNAPIAYSDLTGGGNINDGDVYAQIAVLGNEDSFDLKTTPQAWRDQLQDKYPDIRVSTYVPRLGLPVGKPIAVRVSGSDMQQLQQLAQQVKEAIATIPGTINIVDDTGEDRHALEFEVNEQAMDKYMVSYKDLTSTMMLLNEGLPVSKLDKGSELIDIKLYLTQPQADPNVLFQQLTVHNAAGTPIPLAQLAEAKPAFATQQIKHYNMERTITVEADLTGRTATEVSNDVNQKFAAISFPDGYKWQLGGETSTQNEIFADLGTLSIIVLFLIIILITMQFNSLSVPLIIMTTVYLAAAGGIIGLAITGMPIGFMSIMGVITLAGMVVRNGIVMIEFTQEELHRGTPLEQAVIASAAARFRPILLTSLTAIVGMMPIAWLGSLLFRPLAYTVMFGLLFSTVLTLFVVPSLYLIVARLKQRWRVSRKLKASDQV